MNEIIPDESGDPAVDADTASLETRAVASMNDNLRGDVASWMAARSESVAVTSAELVVPAPRVPGPKSGGRPKKSPSGAAQPAPDKKKPFGMSYDGMSQADYISYMISRGAR